MAPTRNPRNYKRVSQACGNCRRKKTRCPGEKPACSHCVRLKQMCHYPESHGHGAFSSQSSRCDLEDRLAQLEKRFDRALDRPQQAETPESIAASTTSTTPINQESDSGLLPPKSTIAKAIDSYYTFAHRQPLWLFEKDGSLTPGSNEELLLAILSIAVQKPSREFRQDNVRSSEVYRDASRSLIMLKIASASVNVSVLQALCLLAYSYLLGNDTYLASFHATLARTLLQCSKLAKHGSQERTPRFEEHRRLVWSIFLLDFICGQQHRTPSLMDDIRNPHYLRPEGMFQHASDRCPSLPYEAYSDLEEKTIGIWGHMVSMVSLWSEVRHYISKCAEGDLSAPWMPNSSYTLINSRVFNTERIFPDFYRYDSANFPHRSIEEVALKREYWLPWMRVQITYHAIHCILNHPFLFSSIKPKTITGTNAFWKTSSQLALLHSTWVARLLDMARNKNLQLSDPFFTYSAVVAATLHTYWSRAANATVQAQAKKNLEICRSFAIEWGPQWPICQSMASLMDKFLHLTLAEHASQSEEAGREKSITTLIWEILEFAGASQDSPGTGLFHPSVGEEQNLDYDVRRGDFIIDSHEACTPDGDIYNTDGHHAPTPDWFSPPAPTQLEDNNLVHTGKEGLEKQIQPQESDILVDTVNHLPASMHWAWAPMDTQIFHDPSLSFPTQGDLNLIWWDTGNL